MILAGKPEELAQLGIKPTWEIRLPFPPSVNSMFINVRGKGRAPSKDYTKWKFDAGWELKAQKPRPVQYRCLIDIDLDETRMGDADNRSKAVLDLLVAHRIIPDDSKLHVKRVSTGWEPITGCRVRISEA